MTELTINCEQVFSRRSLAFVWSKRNEIDAGQMAIIKALYDDRKRGSIKGSVRVEYKLARSQVGKMGYGRLYGTRGSLETLEREIRGTLCEEFYHDIDMKNAHPVILHQFAKMTFNKDLIEVEKYCDNRDDFLKKISENRDEAKTAFLKVMYGGKCDYQFLAGYEKEVSTFAKYLSHRDQYEDLVAYLKKQDKNLYASLLALILQTEERKIMLAMKKSLEKMGWSVDVLAYDGVMVRKSDKMNLSNEMLKEVEEDVFQETKYHIELADKQFEKFDVPPECNEVAPKVTNELYQERKDKFEENHFYFSPNNTIAEITKSGILNFYSLEHASVKFNAFDFMHSSALQDRTPFLGLWLKDSTRRTHSIIDQKPSDDPEVYSPPVVFKWTSTETENKDAVEVFKDVVGLAAGRNDCIRDFMICWFAHLLQKPFENPLSAIILTGREGCGKDTLGDFFCQFMLGDTYSHNYTSTDQFWDKHDCERFGKFFVKIEEASGFVNRKNAGAMKAIITSRTLTVNPKGQKAITTGNYNRFFMTTNEDNPVKVEEGSRRFMISACSPEKIGDVAYWKNVRKILFNAEGAAAVGKYLMSLDLDGFETTVFPKNEYLEQLKEQEKTTEDQFIESLVIGEEKGMQELYELYVQFCDKNKLENAKGTRGLGYKLLVPLRDGKIKKQTKDDKAFYTRIK